MPIKNSKVKSKKSKPRKNSNEWLVNSAYFSLRRTLYIFQKEIEDIRGELWDTESMLREREWESSTNKTSLETRHSFKLYADRTKQAVRSLAFIIKRLDNISIKN